MHSLPISVHVGGVHALYPYLPYSLETGHFIEPGWDLVLAQLDWQPTSPSNPPVAGLFGAGVIGMYSHTYFLCGFWGS